MLKRREFIGAGTGLLASLVIPRGAFATSEALLQHVGSPQNLATPLEYFDRLVTPTPAFFVRSHFGPPALDPARVLRVGGAVKKPLQLSTAGLKRFQEVTLTAVLQCAGNGRSLHQPRVPGVQWIHGAMGQATWTGVRLADVLADAGLKLKTGHVWLLGADGPPKPTVPPFQRSIPLARALDPTTLIAYRMNEAPLTLNHGAPLRLVVPGWAGDHWMKWLISVEVRDREPDGFYMKTAYRMPTEPVEAGKPVPPEKMAPATVFPVKSIIARPVEGSVAPAGRQEVVGVAFSGTASVRRVEVSIDAGKNWKDAKLEGDAGPGRWQVFRFAFSAGPGPLRALVRATDTDGTTQPEKVAWNPSGYFWNGWHGVQWMVR